MSKEKTKVKPKETTVEKYFRLQQDYEEQYGENAIVLYQIGKFYEIYEYDPDLDSEATEKDRKKGKIGKATEANLIFDHKLITRNTKRSYHKVNCNLVGVPVDKYDFCCEKLLNAGYIPIKFDESGQDDHGNIVRQCSEIGSKTTSLNYTPLVHRINNYWVAWLNRRPKRIRKEPRKMRRPKKTRKRPWVYRRVWVLPKY
jgi:DNA mismatch repair ATPase MutS